VPIKIRTPKNSFIYNFLKKPVINPLNLIKNIQEKKLNISNDKTILEMRKNINYIERNKMIKPEKENFEIFQRCRLFHVWKRITKT